MGDFPGGPLVNSSPINAGNKGLIPTLERSHATGQLSHCAVTKPAHATTEGLTLWSHALQQDKPSQ